MHACISILDMHACVCIHCIVLYLAIYKALLTAKAFQKRSQCEQPRGKRQDFSLEKDEERLPERMAERTGGGSPFHREGPMQAKNLD